jgi:Tol biopolymer transport system component
LRCSTNAGGGQATGGGSHYPCISADGRYVAFYSSATDLVPGDTNTSKDVFRKDLHTGAIVRCSTDAAGSQVSGASAFPSISADGRYVAFASEAATLVSGDSNGKQDIFRKDVLTGAIVRCSTTASGGEVTGASSDPSISADGRYVAFASEAATLVSGDSNGKQDIFRKDLETGAIVRCSTTVVGGQLGQPSYNPSIGSDGSYVAFESDSPNLVESDFNGARDIFRKDLQTGATAICSTDAAGNEGNAAAYDACVSADGRFVAFYSSASNLVPGDTNAQGDIFRKELVAPVTFYFAEGYTGAGFEEWLCLMNPFAEPANVHMSFLMEGGATQDSDIQVPGNARYTISVNAFVGADKNVSIKVTSDLPIVAERPMYFNYQGAWTGGHDVMGATSPREEFYFAEGYTGAGFEEWLCLMNPNPSPTTAHVTYFFRGGASQTQDVGIGANTRATVNVNAAAGPDKEVSMRVTSDDPIVAERPMYFNYRGLGDWNWTGGHIVMGYAP